MRDVLFGMLALLALMFFAEISDNGWPWKYAPACTIEKTNKERAPYG